MKYAQNKHLIYTVTGISGHSCLWLETRSSTNITSYTSVNEMDTAGKWNSPVSLEKL